MTRMSILLAFGVFHGAKKTKAGEKTGFDHIPRIVYAIFWRTVSSRALSPFARDAFGAFGTIWSPDSFFEYWTPRSMLLMLFAFIVMGLSVAAALDVGFANERPQKQPPRQIDLIVPQDQLRKRTSSPYER